MKAAKKTQPKRRSENQLRAMRVVLGLRRPEIAEALGIAADTLKRYEMGTRRIPNAAGRKLAMRYGIDASSLYSQALRDWRGQPYSQSSWEAWSKLREYQRDCLIRAEEWCQEVSRLLFIHARGSGKVAVLSEELMRFYEQVAEKLGAPRRVVVMSDEDDAVS